MSPFTNEQYLKGIREKDTTILRSIYREFFPMVAHYVRSNQGSRSDAEDMFHNALEAIYRKLREGEITLTASFSTYLFEICRRQWLKHLRPRKYESGVTPEDAAVYTEVAEIEPVVEQTERYQLMREKFAKLGEDCRQLLSLSWHTDKSMEEIAAQLGMTYAYARKRKTICKDRLVALVKADRRYAELSS